MEAEQQSPLCVPSASRPRGRPRGRPWEDTARRLPPLGTQTPAVRHLHSGLPTVPLTPPQARTPSSTPTAPQPRSLGDRLGTGSCPLGCLLI